MSKHLERDLEHVEQEILAMSSMVEDMIQRACRALVEREPSLAVDVIDSDTQVDEREVHIEDDCLKIFALHQPVASDLRRTATVMKINNDLERIADLAVNIAERGRVVASHPQFPIPETFSAMATEAISMVREALDSFVKLDAGKAREVLSKDDHVDDMNRAVIGELMDLMKEQPSMIDAALHCFSASRHVERIADHATNIAEDVIYLVEGEIARHKYDESFA